MDWIQNILPTLLVVSTGLLTWFLKDKSEKLKLQREKLIEEKRLNYEKILEPIIRVFSGAKNKSEMAKAVKQIQSHEYRKSAFQLMLFGSDGVVNAYNNFFQYLYNNESNLDPYKMLHALGNVVLEIRKDLGNNSTALKEYDMLRFMITDIDRVTN
ncbi:hypothetical protein [Fulvivirga lutea]|uniref:DUF4760 domain-containing protein n=1 Tax=Fulvivirga lutea TaxID=2810512 RepID=A0A974WL28_9BACT|nr:hypothetical protein [Fulvivirga lutea]QSE99197.1 hypothetical protein JR347_08940 [Fulvivirga lutea]